MPALNARASTIQTAEETSASRTPMTCDLRLTTNRSSATSSSTNPINPAQTQNMPSPMPLRFETPGRR